LSPHPADKRLLKKQAEKGNSCGSLFLNRIRIRKTRKAFVGYCLLLQPKKNNPIVVYYSQATPLLFLFFFDSTLFFDLSPFSPRFLSPSVSSFTRVRSVYNRATTAAHFSPLLSLEPGRL
jgi:hypothetical protein